MIMIDERLFIQDWFVSMDVEDRYMFLYLLSIASRKTGIFEWSDRMINFGANLKRHYSKDDVIRLYGNRIMQIPDHPDTMIFPAYISENWLRNGKRIDNDKNPLFRAITSELSRFGLTIDKVLDMAEQRTRPCPECTEKKQIHNSDSTAIALTNNHASEKFDMFWKAYPGYRKTDKKRCREKFANILRKSSNEDSMFERIMNGLDKWKEHCDWIKDNGKFICAPLVWLNNSRWEIIDEQQKGWRNGTGEIRSNKIADIHNIF